MSRISADELRRFLSYDPETGIFRWLVSSGRCGAGEVAGSLTNHAKPYVDIGLRGRHYRAHRLAWFYVYGEWPERIDHRDLDRLNNRLANLRKATHQQNMFNRGADADNKVGLKGVSPTPFNKFRASIWVGETQHYLGNFNTPDEAHAAYCEAAIRLHGEFARAACPSRGVSHG